MAHASQASTSQASKYQWPTLRPANSQSHRIFGDSPLPVQAGEMWHSGAFYTEAPLPDGYPTPTPEGCIEIKTYPKERRAEFDSSGMWFRGLLGQSRAFWPLFSHIKKRQIPMTAPVQMDYDDFTGKKNWIMSFLYKNPEVGQTGETESSVKVTDRPEITVISVALPGDAGEEVVQRGVVILNEALDAQSTWVGCG